LNILISLSSCVSEGLSVNDACWISRSRPERGPDAAITPGVLLKDAGHDCGPALEVSLGSNGCGSSVNERPACAVPVEDDGPENELDGGSASATGTILFDWTMFGLNLGAPPRPSKNLRYTTKVIDRVDH
jgi:hypothetical protein